jgi:hypothetical protein
MRFQPRLRITLLLPCLCLSACSTATFPVEGTVTVDGKPLDHGTVVFWPENAEGNTSPDTASSEIGANGTYALYTQGKEGAPIGVYRVTVVSQTQLDSTKPEKVKSLVPKKYTRREETDLRIKVVEDPSDGAYDLKLK